MKKGLTKRFAAILTAALMSIPLYGNFTGIKVYADSEPYYEEIVPEVQPDHEAEAFSEPDYSPMFAFPENVRGIYITPGADFSVYDEEGDLLPGEEIAENAGYALDSALEKKLNAVIIETSAEGELFFDFGVNKTAERSPAEICAEEAASRGMYVYVTFDIGTVMNGINESSAKAKIDRLAVIVHEFAVNFPVDGIILDGYYSAKSSESFGDYLKNGAGIGYNNWLYENNAYIFSLAADAVHRTTNCVPVGISLNDVWANYTTDEKGSGTSVNFEALTNGYADTLGYIEKGCADFMIVKADGAIGSINMPFEEIIGWWDNVAQENDIPMLIDHINEKICTDAAGWQSPDELVKQVILADNYSSCMGSAFNSLDALNANAEESTEVLLKHFNDKIDLEGLNSELEMTLPTETTFKTEEPTVIFAGSFDPNFTIYFQGEPIELNEAGRFYFNMDLDVGVNTFTFKNKGKTVTYTITRTVNVLKNVEPSGGSMRVEGQSAITLSAIAYKDSDVTAEINGKSIDLKPVEGQIDGIDPNSNYTKYIGTYVAPEGIKGQDIELGSVTFYGTYHTKTGDINESRTGCSVTVNALAEIVNDYSGSLLEVKNDNTMVYDYKSTSTDPTPDMARLPAGTLDYLVKTVTYSGTDYYLTNSGKRIRTDSVNVLENKPLGSNPISVTGAAKDGTDTVIKLRTASRIPFSMDFSGVNYSEGDNGNYYVSGFSADALTITFDYITSISSGDIEFPASAVFTKGTWGTYESGELTKTTLTLTLRQSGIFGGVTSSYNDDGELVFRFNGCRSSLDGATVVIDPGHGYTGADQFDPGAVGHVKEQEVNLAVAKKLAEKLEARGARVIRLNTESETYVTAQRASIARQYSPDLFISIHCNSAGENAKGAEAYYFTPYSQPLAKAISSRIGTYLSNNVHGSGDMDRGSKYNYFFVTQQQDFPSVLVECGFVTNYTEAMALADSSHQSGIAEAIAQGAADYLARTDYSCYGDGDAVYTNSADHMSSPVYDSGESPSSDDDSYSENDSTEQPSDHYETEYAPAETEQSGDNDFFDPYSLMNEDE